LLAISGATGVIGRHFPSSVQSIAFRKFVMEGSGALPTTLPSTFVHLAGVVGEGNVRRLGSEARRLNVHEGLNLLQELEKRGVSTFINVSTAHVYAPTSNQIDEKSRVDPQSEYGKQKLEFEILGAELASNLGLKFINARVFSLLGLGMTSESLIGAVFKLIEGGVPLRNGADLRDFMKPAQAAEYLRLLANLESESLPRIINVLSGNPKTVKQAVIDFCLEHNYEVREELILDNYSERPSIIGANRLLLKLLRAEQP
jgi:nucleoside-diphosphate-sugar epimerase